MWWTTWRRINKINWTAHRTDEEVSEMIGEERARIRTIRQSIKEMDRTQAQIRLAAKNGHRSKTRRSVTCTHVCMYIAVVYAHFMQQALVNVVIQYAMFSCQYFVCIYVNMHACIMQVYCIPCIHRPIGLGLCMKYIKYKRAYACPI